MLRHVERREDTEPRLQFAALNVHRIATDADILPQVRAGAAKLAAKLAGPLGKAEERRKAVESFVGEVTGEYDLYDVR